MLTDGEFHDFAFGLAMAVHDINKEAQVSVEVKGLAEMVRQAKDAVRVASDNAARLRDAAKNLDGTLMKVDGLTRELEDANAELEAAVGSMTNGGPPLETGGVEFAPPEPEPPLTVRQPRDVPEAIKQVEQANRG